MFDLGKLEPKNREEAAELAVKVLGFIEGLLDSGSEAASVIMVLRTVFKALAEYRDGKVTADDVHAELRHLSSAIAKNDDAADAALREKFDKEPT